MIPNLINTAIGLWLVYAAVLNPAEIGGRAVVLACGVVVFGVAIWAYRADYLKWPSTTAGILGASLAVYAAVEASGTSGFITFWVGLFVGIAMAVVSLWSALYRQPSAPEYYAGGRTPPGSAQDERREEHR
jgi:hypothetical protein